MTINIQEVRQMVKAMISSLKLLPFENDYKKGQMDMAETLNKLLDVIENKEGVKCAEEYEMREARNEEV